MQALLLPSEHCPHAPDDWQAGVLPPQSTSPAQARQVCVIVLHTGVTPPHCAFDVHGTQVPADTRQAGVLPVHLLALLAEQTPHAPDGWQAGVAPPQSLSPPHARQVCVDRLQTGVVPPHWAFDVQATQLPAEVLQTGVVPEHCAPFVAEHWPHAPDAWQAGSAPPQSSSAAQPRQAWKIGSHTGVAPPHAGESRHCTHVPFGV